MMTVRWLVLLACVAGIGCSSSAKTDANQPPPPPAPGEIPAASAARVPSVREAFPREKKEESSALLKIMKESKVVGTKSGHQVIYRMYGVDCRVGGNGKYTCTYGLSAGCSMKACRQSVKSSEALASLLFGLPVSQGDSGVVTPYVECASSSDDPSFASCSVATMLDYSGP